MRVKRIVLYFITALALSTLGAANVLAKEDISYARRLADSLREAYFPVKGYEHCSSTATFRLLFDGSKKRIRVVQRPYSNVTYRPSTSADSAVIGAVKNAKIPTPMENFDYPTKVEVKWIGLSDELEFIPCVVKISGKSDCDSKSAQAGLSKYIY
ncbi:MAG: hypothetical protein C0469_10005 [Cyanobacteria bacterium DS2.3.42]|nr:hypothetical protein [Cyanobacteria bacterium DS2.3.42]